MYITSWLLALQLIGTMSAAPSWNRDYGEALTRAGATKKPVAVFIASGKDGWKSVTTEGELGLEVRRLLVSRYSKTAPGAQGSSGTLITSTRPERRNCSMWRALTTRNDESSCSPSVHSRRYSLSGSPRSFVARAAVRIAVIHRPALVPPTASR